MESLGLVILVMFIIISVTAVGLFLTPQVDRGNILVEDKSEPVGLEGLEEDLLTEEHLD